jgi:uncharacterized membrane protein YgcG
MKSKLPIFRNFGLFSLIGSLSLFVISCGSYQNSSFYDNDGIYGSSERPNNPTNQYQEQNATGNQYANQFRNMQNDFGYFTDVDNYTSENDSVVTVYNRNYNDNTDNYAGWGKNSSNVTINYYDNWGWNGWYGAGWGLGWGTSWNSWNSPWGWNGWYGAGWGWTGPGWGLGWNGWYGAGGWGWNNWYSGYYGTNISYSNGPRGRNQYYANRNSRDRNQVDFNRNRSRNNANPNSGNNNPRNSYSNPNNSSNPRNNNTVTPRSTPRTSTPRSSGGTISTPRSSGGGSFGGSSGGGGRSGGGGGRGGRG